MTEETQPEVEVEERKSEEELEAELQEFYRINDVLIGCANALKEICEGLTSIEAFENEYGTAKSVMLTLAMDMISSIERRGAAQVDEQLEERRRKDRELTEQDKDIMALVKELQDPNKG